MTSLKDLFYVFGSVQGISFGFVIAVVLGLSILRGLEKGRYGSSVTTHPLKRYGLKMLASSLCVIVLLLIFIAVVCAVEVKNPIQSDVTERLTDDLNRFSDAIKGAYDHLSITYENSIFQHEIDTLRKNIEIKNSEINDKKETAGLLYKQIELRDEIDELNKEIEEHSHILEERTEIHSSKLLELKEKKVEVSNKRGEIREIAEFQLFRGFVCTITSTFLAYNPQHYLEHVPTISIV